MKAKTEMRQVLLQIPSDLLARVEAQRERARKAAPGYLLSRSDIIRSLIAAGLDRAEAKAAEVQA
jgi:hypothetical protein